VLSPIHRFGVFSLEEAVFSPTRKGPRKPAEGGLRLAAVTPQGWC
jgi:hypothetical protein